MKFTISCVASAALALAMLTNAQAIVIPIDDFEDGNLDGWTLLDFSASETWGPGDYNVSTGVLRASHTGLNPGLPDLVPVGTPFTQTALFSIWDDSAVPLYSDGYLRAQIKTDELENSTTIMMRADLSTFSAYILFGNTNTSSSPGSGKFNLNKFVNGVEYNVWRSDFTYGIGEWWNVELGAVGTDLSAKVWRVGDPEPASPQFEGTDTSNTLGQIALSSDVSPAHTVDGRADGSFDNVIFCAIPEPSTIALMAFSLTLVVLQRRR